MGIVLCADSTCDLGDELKNRYNVHYYPFHVIYRGREYQDNVTIFPEDLYKGYYEDGSLPSTSAINVQEYLDFFSPFVEAGDQVIHLNLGSALSSAHSNAVLAAEQLDGVFVIDSGNLSTGISLQIIRAAKLIEQGWAAEDIVAEIKAMRPRVHSSFVLETLDFMAAGGRCPSVLAHVGKALKIRPEIVVDNRDASMSMGKIYRGKSKKVLVKYVDDTLSRYFNVQLDDIFITHSGIEQECIDVVAEELLAKLPGLDAANIHVTQASCTISCHCGPGTLGILFTTER